MKARIAISYTPETQAAAEQLATHCPLPLQQDLDYSPDFILAFTAKRLELQSTHSTMSPIYVDFLEGKNFHRRQFGGGRRQLIAKACGIKSDYKPRICDLTAGLGRDGFVLANLGCDVTLIERNPIIAALLADGLKRGQQQAWFQQLALVLVEGSAFEFLQGPHSNFDVYYLDPMFGKRSKSALVKKDMRVLRDIVGDDSDCDALLKLALTQPHKRIVVKRAINDPPLANAQPDISYRGKSSRLDVFF